MPIRGLQDHVRERRTTGVDFRATVGKAGLKGKPGISLEVALMPRQTRPTGKGEDATLIRKPFIISGN